jgi:threonine synthase
MSGLTGMRYTSTRATSSSQTGFSEALAQGLAPDGGLYVPVSWPSLRPQSFANGADLPTVATTLIAPFAEGDELASSLPAITRDAFNFPVPLVPLPESGGGPAPLPDAGGRALPEAGGPATESRLHVLELFHGPTAAFKDFGARFLAASLSRLRKPGARPLTILVATSGDTGGAVAAAFHERPGIEVAVLFPKGLVSPTQERQLTCWGGNVRSFAVRGTFDDCQRLVKQAFLDPQLREQTELSSANSINLGRLLPQAVYYAATSLAIWRRYGEPASFVVPSGNLGNAVACIWARKIGLPIADVVLAHNANRTVADYLSTGEWRPRPSIATLASAMDVGNPSNMERLRALFPDVQELRSAVSAVTIEDADIRARIRAGFEKYGQIWCPHTATAAEAYERLPAERRARGRWVLVSTAHPAKFSEIVEPLIGRRIPVPDSLAKLFARPTECTEIDAELSTLRAALAGGRAS